MISLPNSGYLFRKFNSLAFLFILISGTSSSSDWYSRRVQIYDCNSNNHLTVKYVRNNSRVIFDQIAQPSLWIQYHETSNPFSQMFAMEKNGELFFMEVINGRVCIIKNQEPTGFAQQNDNRLFLYRTNIHNRNDILMHVVTQSYITHRMRGAAIAIVTADPAQAINICMQYQT